MLRPRPWVRGMGLQAGQGGRDLLVAGATITTPRHTGVTQLGKQQVQNVSTSTSVSKNTCDPPPPTFCTRPPPSISSTPILACALLLLRTLLRPSSSSSSHHCRCTHARAWLRLNLRAISPSARDQCHDDLPLNPANTQSSLGRQTGWLTNDAPGASPHPLSPP